MTISPAMKNTILFLLLSLIVFQSCSRGTPNSPTTAETQTPADTLIIPTPVLYNFNERFPTVSELKWRQDGENFEATFRDTLSQRLVLFSPDGEVVLAETGLNPNSLPEGVLNYINANLKDKTIESAKMVITTAGSITYEIRVEGKDYIFSGDGTFMSSESVQ